MEQSVRLRVGVVVLGTDADAMVCEGEVVLVERADDGMGETVPEVLVLCETL